ncbi:MAG: nucleoside triphosphate pyrophosphohydrolase [Solirubrobacteraceae bacterium]
MSAPERNAAALARLDQLTRRLRRECPWDREQDERSIVPHTVEEAFELADAAHGGDDGKLVDELGDVLFQVHFLSLLLEERGAGDLAEVAERCHAKLVRRHPHVFGEVEVGGASEVLRNWDRIKEGEEGSEPGLFGDVPENLPGPLYARRVQRRAASTGFDWADVEGPLDAVREELAEVEEAARDPLSSDEAGRDATRGPLPPDDAARDARFHEVGDLLFAAVSVARKLRVDPELALRAAADRFRARVDRAAALASEGGAAWADLTSERQIEYYSRAHLDPALTTEGPPGGR